MFRVAALERKGSPRSTWTVGQLHSSGQGAIETAASPDGRYGFVTLENSNELAVFNLRRALHQGFGRSDLVGTVPLGVAPVGMAIAPDGKHLYVTSEATTLHRQQGTLTTVNLSKAERQPAHAVISVVPVGCSPVRVAATGTSVYVTARGSDALLAFNAQDLVDRPSSPLVGEVPVGEAPVGLVLVDHDRTVVVADSDRFSAPGRAGQPGRRHVAGRWPDGIGRLRPGRLVPPGDMAVNRVGNTILVSNFAPGQLEEVDARTLP